MIVSHYPDEMYDKFIGHWRNFEYESTTRRGKATEKLWLNFEHDTGYLHDYQYLGSDKHERYNLKHRAAKNLIAKLEKMEMRRRQAMLHYLREGLKKWS